MTIESGSSLIQTHTGTDANTNNGTYNVKRVGGGSNMSYNIWSSPIMAAPIHGTGAVYDGTNPCDIFTFNASTQEWKYDYPINYLASCNGNNVTFSAAYLMTDGVSDNIMDPTRGYYVPGNTNTERAFTGNVNNGDITTTIWSTNITTNPWAGVNWNLVGNPYPSAIDLQTFWNVNTASGAITDGVYFWNDPGNQNYQCSDFVVWNSIGTTNSCGVSSSTTANGLVSSGQGFWVYGANSGTTTTTIVFNNAMRTGGNNTNFYKMTKNFERVWLSFSRNGQPSNQILLGLRDDASVGYDPKFDARKLPADAALELAFVQDSGHYVILAQPTLSYDEQEELPLYVVTDSTTYYTFAFDSTKNITGGNTYFLIDKFKRITHDLSTPYQVRLDSGKYENRFYLLYKDLINGVNENPTTVNFVEVYQTDGNIKLQSNKLNITTVTMYNSVGALLTHKENLKQTAISIPISNYASGVYLINYKLTNGDSKTEKVVLN